jgi:hypothetical protein
MSDFLDRLIERSLGLAPVVRPRLPSLFEPPGLDAAAGPEQTTEAAEPARASGPRAATMDAPVPPEFTDAPRSRRRAPAHEFAPPVGDEPASHPPARPSRTATTEIRSGESAPPEPRPHAGTSPQRPLGRETQTPGPPSSQPAPPPAHTRPEVEHVARVFTPPRAASEEHGTTIVNLAHPEQGVMPAKSFEPPTRRESVAQDGANDSGQLSELGRQVEGLQQQVERMQLRPAVSEVRVESRSVEGERTVERVREVPAPAPPPAPVPPAEQRPARAEAPVFVQPRETQRAAPRLEADERARARTPEPTVNVTIGRIEVRAAQTAEPPARQERSEQPPAAMSLREYLRKRSGGHSR